MKKPAQRSGNTGNSRNTLSGRNGTTKRRIRGTKSTESASGAICRKPTRNKFFAITAGRRYEKSDGNSDWRRANEREGVSPDVGTFDRALALSGAQNHVVGYEVTVWKSISSRWC